MITRTIQQFRFITVAAVFVATFATIYPVYAQNKAKVKSSIQARYVSKAGFSFAVPPKWQRDDADISMERMRYVLTTADGKVVASIKASTLRDKDVTTDSLAENLRQTIKENTGTIIAVRDETVNVGKIPGIIFETNNTRPSEPDTEMTLLTTHNGITSKVVVTCKTADRAKYAPIFANIVESFKW